MPRTFGSSAAALALLLAGCSLDRVAAPAPLSQPEAATAEQSPAAEATASRGPALVCFDACSARTGRAPSAPPPLFIINGVQYPVPQGMTSPAIELDPNDIISVEIIKGRAAAALYGDAGANGVLIIQTKHTPRAAPAGARTSPERAGPL